MVTKIVQRIQFEGDWGELEAKNCFQRRDNHGQNIGDKL